MHKYTFKDKTGAAYTRVNKAVARKAWNNGEQLLMVPARVRPDNMWGIGVIVETGSGSRPGESFDKFVNEFEYYNCSYNELGKYAAFYLIS